MRTLESSRPALAAMGASLGRSFHAFVFVAYPVVFVVGTTAPALPVDRAAIARCLAIAVALTAGSLVALKTVIVDLSVRAACVSFASILSFGCFLMFSGASTHVAAASLYTCASIAIALLVVRPWQRKPRQSTALNLAACTLLVVNASRTVAAIGAEQPWRPAADALIHSVVSTQAGRPAGPQPDIYYLILDGFGRPDVLQELYGLDLQPFVKALEGRGFVIPDASQSNYAQTYLSMASSLNLSYLDGIAATMRDSSDRRALDYLIQQNALMTIAKRAGYEVVAIGSDYSASERFDVADQCLCEQYGLSEIEVATLNLTPLRALPLHRWTYDAHRRKFDAAFNHLQQARSQTRPNFVFAHVLSPHPPFVFASDGTPRSSGKTFSFSDGSHFPGPRSEYIAGYRDQARFVTRRILDAIDAILQRPGPAPVIVIHGDHGPGSMWDWNDIANGNPRERLGIFSAYRFPGDDFKPSPQITPVNALRVMANRYLGTALPTLPDASFASNWKRPYDWIRVEAH